MNNTVNAAYRMLCKHFDRDEDQMHLLEIIAGATAIHLISQTQVSDEEIGPVFSQFLRKWLKYYEPLQAELDFEDLKAMALQAIKNG